MQIFYIFVTHELTSPILTICEFQQKTNPPPATTNSIINCVGQLASLGNVATPKGIPRFYKKVFKGYIYKHLNLKSLGMTE